MFEELRESFEVVLVVNLSNDGDWIQKGNPTARVVSCEVGTLIGSCEYPVSGIGFRSHDDFEQVEKRVDLIIFGGDVSSRAARALISRFAQRDAILLFDADAGSISFDDLAATGAVDARVFSLHRLPGTLVIGCEPGADFGTRVHAKLLSEFLSPLGRTVSGARAVMDGPFARPGLVGS
jgi:hypothetical protein